MDTLTGAAVAAAVAWLSILAAALVPARWVPRRSLQWGGGASLALLGLAVMGVPIHAWLPLGVLTGALAVGLAFDRPDPQAP